MKKKWRQRDVAARAGVSPTIVSRIERGTFGNVGLDTVLLVARALGIRVDWKLISLDADLDRLMNARHSALHESVARKALNWTGWILAPEVTFSIYGERGIIDILAWHQQSRTLLIIELKTAIVDVNELMGKMDQRQRLAVQVARKRGWFPRRVATWVIVADSSMNRSAVARHRTTLRSAFPEDGRRMRGWLNDPGAAVRGLSLWSNEHRGAAKGGFAAVRRVRPPRPAATERERSLGSDSAKLEPGIAIMERP
jgi:transcriptional regulator with XRE-family HTH domain